MIIRPNEMVQCLRIEPKNGAILRLVLSYPTDLMMANGTVYKGAIYAQPSAISSANNGSPTVIDIGSVYDIDTVTRDQIESGYWDGAKVYSFFTQWSYPNENDFQDSIYTIGKVRDQDDRYVIELMGSLDLLNQSNGRVITAGCPYTLGDIHVDGSVEPPDRSRCQAVVANVNSQVISITSQMEFVGDGLNGYPADRFGYGEIMFTTGLNASVPFKFIAESRPDGTIVLAQPFYYPINVGDEFTVRPGCRKRFEQDCIIKYANGVHFGGFPHKPQKSSVIKFGDQ